MLIGKHTIHLHSISVHFTNSLYPVAVFFLIIFDILQYDPFRATYYNLIILASISAPISYVTGISEWKQKYQGVRVGVFVKKIRYGAALLVLGSTCALWTFIFPEILSENGAAHLVFIILNLAIIPLVVYLGYLGGKLVFGGSH